MMSREAAIELIRKHVSKEFNVKHMIAVGAIMHGVALKLNEDAERWELAGLLHDVDFEMCSGPTDHTLKAQELLQGIVDQEIIDVIKAHNWEHTHIRLDSKFKLGLVCCDAASGLLVACALVMPNKKLSEVKPESVLKKYGSKDFAKGASRERMAMCSQIGLDLPEFLSIALTSMRERAQELGL